MRITITALLIVTTWVALILGLWHANGANGLGIALYIVVGSWFLISRTTGERFRPLNQYRPTVLEFLTVLAICWVLRGLALPAVQM